MCGISGVFRFDGQPVLESSAVQMIQRLSHRGPDGTGIFVEGQIALAHSRLSIIDLESGSQPMYSDDQRYVIVFNGEVYNYLELKQILLKRGRIFKTKSDTEVLLYWIIEFGPEKLSEINGQFAFAMFDKRNRSLLLARDLMGEKPLYFSLVDQRLIFASEVKAIVEFCRGENIQLNLNKQALSDFLSLNYVPFGETLFSEIKSFSPGSYVEVSSQRPSWNYQTISFPRYDQALHFEELMLKATEYRLRSDRPTGIFLSGGFDSTAVAVSSSRLLGKLENVPKAFSLSFTESSFDESVQAEKIAKELNLPFKRVPFNFDPLSFSSDLKKLVYHGDQPLGDSSSYAVYCLSKAASEEVKVILTGDGADELFGGYLTYRATGFAKLIPNLIRALLYNMLPLFSKLPASNRKVAAGEMLRRFIRNLKLPPSEAHVAWNGMWYGIEKNLLFRSDFLETTVDLNVSRRLTQSLKSGESFLSAEPYLLLDQKNYLVDDILAKADRMSMAHGLELRPVYLDPHIVNFARNQRFSLFQNFKKETLLPFINSRIPSWRSGPKKGFSIPLNEWFRSHPELLEIIESSNDLDSLGLNKEVIKKALQDHREGKENYGFEIWGLMTLIEWHAQFGHVSTINKSRSIFRNS